MLYCFASFTHSVHFDLSGSVGEVGEMHHRRPLIHRSSQLINGFDLDELDSRGPQLVIKRDCDAISG